MSHCSNSSDGSSGIQSHTHTHVATHIRTLRCFIGSHNKHLEHTTACSMHQRAGFGEASTYMLLALIFLEINSRTVFLPSPGQKMVFSFSSVPMFAKFERKYNIQIQRSEHQTKNPVTFHYASCVQMDPYNWLIIPVKLVKDISPLSSIRLFFWLVAERMLLW